MRMGTPPPAGSCSRRCSAPGSRSSTARSSTSPCPPSRRTSTPAPAELQWVVNAYLVTLSAFVLLGGSLGDRYGRKRVFLLGLAGFTGASLLCGLAPNVGVLIAARSVQGVGAALLVPGSLAIISATFHPDDRAAAVGVWSGLGGVAGAVGPFVGGYLIDSVSWRLAFFINLPLALGRAGRQPPRPREPGGGRAPPRPGRRGDGLRRPGAEHLRTDRGPPGRRGGGRRGARAVRGGGGTIAGSHAPADPLPEPPVQRGQPHHARRLRRPQRGVLPAGPPAAARARLLGPRGGICAAARHPAHGQPLVARRAPGPSASGPASR